MRFTKQPRGLRAWRLRDGLTVVSRLEIPDAVNRTDAGAAGGRARGGRLPPAAALLPGPPGERRPARGARRSRKAATQGKNRIAAKTERVRPRRGAVLPVRLAVGARPGLPARPPPEPGNRFARAVSHVPSRGECEGACLETARQALFPESAAPRRFEGASSPSDVLLLSGKTGADVPAFRGRKLYHNGEATYPDLPRDGRSADTRGSMGRIETTSDKSIAGKNKVLRPPSTQGPTTLGPRRPGTSGTRPGGSSTTCAASPGRERG